MMVDLKTGQVSELEGVSGNDVESYHSWSSNGHWLVFSSRRVDGLYTHPYLVHVDGEGHWSKPFAVPRPILSSIVTLCIPSIYRNW